MHLLTIQLMQKKKLKECETAIRMIPSCLTLKLQPLDISVNKVLKQIFRNKYVNTALRITNLKFLRTLRSNGWMKYGIQTLSLPIKLI